MNWKFARRSSTRVKNFFHFFVARFCLVDFVQCHLGLLGPAVGTFLVGRDFRPIVSFDAFYENFSINSVFR